jgi:ATP-dependent RNA helicase A
MSFAFVLLNNSRLQSSQGPKFRQRFLCEVRINGYPYVGAGNSTNKKDAEKNAARDFVSFLVRTGKIKESDVPNEGNDQPPAFSGSSQPGPSTSYDQQGSFGQSNLSNFQPNQLGQAYRPAQYDRSEFGPNSYMDRAQQAQRMEEAESLDVNAGIHGNWTIENAKSKLNQFMQANKIQGEFRYQSVGPDHNRYDFLQVVACLVGKIFDFLSVEEKTKIFRGFSVVFLDFL